MALLFSSPVGEVNPEKAMLREEMRIGAVVGREDVNCAPSLVYRRSYRMLNYLELCSGKVASCKVVKLFRLRARESI